jgi:hypothetical protein
VSVPSSARARPDALGSVAVALWAVSAVVVLVALALWQRNGYWEYSDGVYALTARLLADGHDLYDEVTAAQPPPIYLFGAAVLTVSDSLTALRVALAAVELVTSGLVLAVVWRLTGSRPAAVVAALLALLTPWSLREHAQLLPETFAAPLLIGAALAAGRARTVALAGLLAALATAFKLAFALPALVLLLAVPLRGDRLRALVAYAAGGLVLALLSLLLFGGGLLDGAVDAQRESGIAGLSYVGGLWAQGLWNLLPLLLCAALVWPLRAWLEQPDLLRTTAAAALGALLLFATLLKTGSYLTIVVVAEPPLLCLAAAGVVAALRAGSLPASALATLALLLGGAQVGSLLLSPGDPRPFTRPLADSGPARKLSPAEVDAAVAAIRACPSGSATNGPPFLAFAAGRRIAGDQPDQFILQHAPDALARFAAEAAADGPRCP